MIPLSCHIQLEFFDVVGKGGIILDIVIGIFNISFQNINYAFVKILQ